MTHFDPIGTGVVWLGPTGEWNELDLDGRRLQPRGLEDYERVFETLQVVLRAQPAEARRELEEAEYRRSLPGSIA